MWAAFVCALSAFAAAQTLQIVPLPLESVPELQATGPIGARIAIESTTAIPSAPNAAVWTVLTNATLTSSTLRIADSADATSGARFYRARVLDPGSTGPSTPGPEGFVWIPPGTFLMGSPVSEIDRDGDESPQTLVTLSSGFWMGRHEVTQAEYLRVMGVNPSYFVDERKPVERVEWSDAAAYCERLTAVESAAGRLAAGYAYQFPTEAEWEYACRSGTTTPFAFGESLSSQQANFNGNWPYQTTQLGPFLNSTTAVESYAPNPWGLYDMHGNAWEWCADWYAPYAGGSVTDPTGPAKGDYRIIRGGCWFDGGWFCRSAYRFSFGPGRWFGSIGFRVVLKPQRKASTVASTPPAPTQGTLVRLSLIRTPQLVLRGAAGTTAQVQWWDSNHPASGWQLWTNVTFSTTPLRWAASALPGGANTEYRLLVPETEPAGRPTGFVWIPAGVFTLGAPDSEIGHGWEGPQTPVTISQGFWMQQHEVTQLEFARVSGPHKSYWTGATLPVESLNWYAALDYCSRLTTQERAAGRLPAGFVYRLPTEAEWEYACRAGSQTRYSFGDDFQETFLGDYAWYIGNAGGQTHPVGLKKPNPWGLYDMHGNVWEWCLDWYGAYLGVPVSDPETLEPSFAGVLRTVRGGCWGNIATGCRSGNRNGFGPDNPYYGIGFRPVLARPR